MRRLKPVPLLALLALVGLTACANYDLKNHVTTTKNTDGTVVTEKICDVGVNSLMRDVSGADINVSDRCAVSGSAEAINVNQQSIEAVNKALDLVNKAAP